MSQMESVIQEVVLRFLEGENEGVEIRVNAPREMTIGRSEECDIFLAEKKISRKHCILSVTSDYVRLSDLQSTNGTYVNSKKISEMLLQPNDKFRLGNSLIEIEMVKGETQANEAPVESPKPEALKAPEDLKEEPSEEVPEVEESSGVDLVESSEDSEFELNVEEVPEEKSGGKSKPLSGDLSAMGLADLLQNFSQNRKNGILELNSKRKGQIWIQDGQVIGAEVREAKGLKALYRLLGWNEGTFELHPLPEAFEADQLEEKIEGTVESLLMEGFRQFDELQKIKKGLPDLDAKLILKPHFTAPLSKLHPRVLDILQVVINESIFEAVLDHSHLSDLETSKVVFYLLKKKYIVAE